MARRRGPYGGKGGRPRGARNRIPGHLKVAIVDAAMMAGGGPENNGLVAYLTEMARKEPAAFCSLLGRLLSRAELRVAVSGRKRPAPASAGG